PRADARRSAGPRPRRRRGERWLSGPGPQGVEGREGGARQNLEGVLGLMLAPALALAVVSAAAPMKLAALGFTAVDVNEEQAAFYSDHFSERLEAGGVQVVSRRDMTPEQRDLLSCCPSKLAEALGVDGLISGEISKSEGAYQLKIKIISADGRGTLFV